MIQKSNYLLLSYEFRLVTWQAQKNISQYKTTGSLQKTFQIKQSVIIHGNDNKWFCSMDNIIRQKILIL